MLTPQLFTAYPSRKSGAPGSVVHAYFAAVRDKDAVTMRRLFEQDAELVASGSSVVGREAIAAFYEQGAFNFSDLDPNPGPLQLSGSRVDVEIDLRMNRRHHKLMDTFELAGSRIKRLEIAFLS